MIIYNKSDVTYYQATSEDGCFSSGWKTKDEIIEISKTSYVEVFPLFFMQEINGKISYHNTLQDVYFARIYGIYIPQNINLIGCEINIMKLKRTENHYFINGDGFADYDVWRPKRFQTKNDYKKDGDEPYFYVTASYVENDKGKLRFSNYVKTGYGAVRAIDEETAKVYTSLYLRKEPFILKATKIKMYTVTFSHRDDREDETRSFFTFRSAERFIKTISNDYFIKLEVGNELVYYIPASRTNI